MSPGPESLTPSATVPAPAVAVPAPAHGGQTEAPDAATATSPSRPPSLLARFYTLHIVGTIFPLTAGITLYGWRAIGSLVLMLASTWVAVIVWRRIGRRGPTVRLHHALYLAVLLTLMLPAHLFSQGGSRLCPEPHAWLILPAAALLLVSLLWAIGGVGFSRMQPLLLTYMVVLMLFHTALRPQAVLHRSWAWVGDLGQLEPSAPSTPLTVGQDSWISAQELSSNHAMYFDRNAADRLTAYTRGDKSQHRAGTNILFVIRDTMPPLEDLVVGGHPGPIGASSAVAVIIGGLFLMYRGLVDYRVPLYAVLFTFVGLMLLPVPLVISEGGAIWGPLILPYLRFDPRTLVTFASYELMASPLLLMAFFLATSPSICPLTRRARIVYGVLLGVATSVAQLYLSVSFGPYVALLLVGLLSSSLDARYKPKPLV